MKDILQRLLGIDGVDAVVISSSDGLLIEGLARNGHDIDAVAAIGTYAAQATGRMKELQTGTRLSRVTVEGGDTVAMIESLTDDALLIILLNQPVNLGYARSLVDRYSNRLCNAVSHGSETAKMLDSSAASP